MRKVFAAAVVGLLVLSLAGCGTHYTDDIRRDFEGDFFGKTDEYLSTFLSNVDHVTHELYAPDGLTDMVVGRFEYDGLPVQYAYNAETGTLYTGRTKGGFTHSDAKEYVKSQVNEVLAGTGTSCDMVLTLSWRIACTEYRYMVTQNSGEDQAANRNKPTVSSTWLHRPYLPWDASDEDAEQFLSEILHGSPDGVSDLSVIAYCDSFDEADVPSIFDAFSGIRSVRLYERDSDDQYWSYDMQDDGTLAATYHEKRASQDGGSRWVTSHPGGKSSSSGIEDVENAAEP